MGGVPGLNWERTSEQGGAAEIEGLTRSLREIQEQYKNHTAGTQVKPRGFEHIVSVPLPPSADDDADDGDGDDD
eukprot:3110387-Rhodomonas_salina.1